MDRERGEGGVEGGVNGGVRMEEAGCTRVMHGRSRTIIEEGE